MALHEADVEFLFDLEHHLDEIQAVDIQLSQFCICQERRSVWFFPFSQYNAQFFLYGHYWILYGGHPVTFIVLFCNIAGLCARSRAFWCCPGLKLERRRNGPRRDQRAGASLRASKAPGFIPLPIGWSVGSIFASASFR